MITGHAADRHRRAACRCCPLPQWPTDQQRWARFRLTVRLRIHQIRQAEGINSSRGDEWKTFVPALPAALPSQKQRIGRLVPVPTLPRDADGRFQRREQSA